MRTSTIARSGSCSATTASSDSASPTRATTVVPGVLEQAGEPLAEEHRVLGDHDSHGIATSTRVPLPRGLTISKVPPCAATRSRSPARPDPRRTTAPPTPSSATVTWSVPLSRDRANRHLRRRAVLDGVRERLAGDEVRRRLDARRRALAARLDVDGDRRGSREVAQSAAASPSSSRAGRTPAAIWRRSAIAAPTSADDLVERGREDPRLARAGSAGGA